MPKRHVVRLRAADRTVLTDLPGGGTAPARTLTLARILLKADHDGAGSA